MTFAEEGTGMDGRVLFSVAFALYSVAVGITFKQMQITTLSVIATGRLYSNVV